MTFVLVHGGWHDGSCWDSVADILRKGGYKVFAPTIAGNGKTAGRNVNHEICTASIVDYIVSNDIRDFVLVGHSYGGTIIAKVAEAVPDRLRRLVFWNAFVLLDGQSLLDETPQNVEFVEQGAAASGDDTYLPPFEHVRDSFFNTVSREDALRYYSNWSPQPIQPFRDKLHLKRFHSLEIPTSYLTCTEDIRQICPGIRDFPTACANSGLCHAGRSRDDVHKSTIAVGKACGSRSRLTTALDSEEFGMNKSFVRGTWQKNRAFSPAVITEGAARTVWIAGHTGQVDDSGQSLAGDFDAQCRQTFRNIEKTLAEARCSLKDVVTMTVFLIDSRHTTRMTELRHEIFGENYPASAAITVVGFALPEIMIEIQGIAVSG